MTAIGARHAPKRSIQVCHKEAFDADLHAGNLTNWQQEYDQTSRGGFRGAIVELPFSDLQVFKEVTSQALQQRCVVWPESMWLGIPLQDQQEGYINGLALEPNQIMCRPGSCEFELTTPANYELFGMVVDISALKQMASIHQVELNWSELTQHGRFSLPEKTLADVRFVLNRLLHSHPEQSLQERLTRDVLMIALLDVLKVEQPAPAQTPSYFHRKQVVDTARAFIHANPDKALTVTDLCEVANVSRRSLQYAFETILAMSPIQYLRVSRLNGVRRDLLTTDESVNVADVAAGWGFWHLSQFAKDYRQLFGELPSHTRRLS